MRRLLPILAIAFLLALSGCGSASDSKKASNKPTEPATFDVAGTLTLASESITYPDFSSCAASSGMDAMDGKCNIKKGAPCEGSDGYSDVVAGAQVKVTDNAGKVVGLGTLAAGKAGRGGNPIDLDFPGSCVFTFSVPKVADSGDIYGVEVGQRDVVNFQKSDAQAVALTLGD